MFFSWSLALSSIAKVVVFGCPRALRFVGVDLGFLVQLFLCGPSKERQIRGMKPSMRNGCRGS